MKTQLSDKVRYGVAAVCALLLLIAWQVSARTRLTLASASFESPATYGVKQDPPGNRGPWRYDVNTVETQRGTIVSIDRVSTEVNVGGIHLTLDIGDEQLPVHVGPAWYLEDQFLQITINDTIEVTGSRIVIDGDPALIAAEIKIGDTVIILRDRNGLPRWRHRAPRGPRQMPKGAQR